MPLLDLSKRPQEPHMLPSPRSQKNVYISRPLESLRKDRIIFESVSIVRRTHPRPREQSGCARGRALAMRQSQVRIQDA